MMREGDVPSMPASLLISENILNLFQFNFKGPLALGTVIQQFYRNQDIDLDP